MANKVIGRVIEAKRLGATYWGNPMYEVALVQPDWIIGEDAERLGVRRFRLTNDAMLNHRIANREYSEHAHVFELTRAGRIRRDLGAIYEVTADGYGLFHAVANSEAAAKVAIHDALAEREQKNGEPYEQALRRMQRAVKVGFVVALDGRVRAHEID